MKFFKLRKAKKELKQTLKHARTMQLSREDIMTSGECSFLSENMAAAQKAGASGDLTAITTANKELERCLAELFPPKPLAGWRENFDVMVVAISVAMAFRAYFYQPFKIPTGSMMPTLYGIHSEARAPNSATLLDAQPFKFAKWLITGSSFKVIRAKMVGEVNVTGDTNSKPGYMRIMVGGYNHYIPSDAIFRNTNTGEIALSGTGVKHGQRVKANEVLWSGLVISGDFVFVNRWQWNFAHPTRGEVMVFSTTGINPALLQQGTHYIKRMTGLPNEQLQVKAPNLVINGEVVNTPQRIAQIAAKETLPRANMAYSGFNPAPGGFRQGEVGKSLTSANDVVQLGSDEYYAMGDNSFNSFDSRYWGPVPERTLLGPATVVYWPFTSPRFGWIR